MITLCVLFNHPYPAVIPVVKEIYSSRFSRIIFLQPIIASSEPDIFSSYRGSYNLHGMIADLSDRIDDQSSDAFVFIHDDVLLDPSLNETNILERLKVTERGGFLLAFDQVGGSIVSWHWFFRSLWSTNYSMNTFGGSGLEGYERYLPSFEAARTRLGAVYGYNFPPFTYAEEDLLPPVAPFADTPSREQTYRALLSGLFENTRPSGEMQSAIPGVYGPSDFFIVPRAILADVCHFLGVFAALNLFVEVAIPTALIMAAERVTQARDVGKRFEWNIHPANQLCPAQLKREFSENLLAIHPVKLSRDAHLVHELIQDC